MDGHRDLRPVRGTQVSTGPCTGAARADPRARHFLPAYMTFYYLSEQPGSYEYIFIIEFIYFRATFQKETLQH